MMSNGSSERRRRRSWTDAEKCEIVAETEVPGASVLVAARRHDINANLLFKWKRQFDRDDARDVTLPVAPESFRSACSLQAQTAGVAMADRIVDCLRLSMVVVA